jgi:uncharacterized repeat protein (TIGR03943 family)
VSFHAETRILQLAVASVLLLRLALTDAYLLYVQPAMRPFLIVAGLALAVTTATYARAQRRPSPPDAAPHLDDAGADPVTCGHVDFDPGDDATPSGERHGHSTRIGWLLALPLAALVAMPMEPLGAFAANRRPATLPSTTYQEELAPLPEPVDGAVDMTLGEFVTYAAVDADRQLEDQTVRLTGFVVTPDGASHGEVHLTRFSLSCCAADAWATSVTLHDLPVPVPPDDTWITVEGTWRPDPSGEEPDAPALDVATVEEIPTPTDPYEA